MALIKSISGIRGTIGGPAGDALTPVDIVNFTYAYCAKMKERKKPYGRKYKVVVGKDARLSGEMVENLVVGTLIACGVDVIKIGFASTPTTELAVTGLKADGGIILTASHNPKQWNALKLLDENGEFLNAAQGQAILDCAASGRFDFCTVEDLGHVTEEEYVKKHIKSVLKLDLVDRRAIKKARFKVVVDAVNSVGGVIMPKLLKELGVKVIQINCEPTGDFAHNPEPLPANLVDLSKAVVKHKADLGISVDPDVDRLALICEDGKPFGEEYTLVSVADYVLSAMSAKARKKGKDIDKFCKPYSFATSSNLSSSRALRDVTERLGGRYEAAAVGEVNVVAKMKEIGAVIGGEGNGGVIYPELHYGRDAMVGVALFLSNLAHRGLSATQLKATYPEYFIAKNKIQLSDPALVDKVLEGVRNAFANEDINTVDGVKISFESERKWVHLRRSNTEPIIRIYAEAPSMTVAEELGNRVITIANDIISYDL
ncbi:MAG: phosphoglucosamine mutase [Bacteroidales bacterium]|nr:phosphoglucosamine mutase [Candidatus Hennigimonas equi]